MAALTFLYIQGFSRQPFKVLKYTSMTGNWSWGEWKLWVIRVSLTRAAKIKGAKVRTQDSKMIFPGKSFLLEQTLHDGFCMTILYVARTVKNAGQTSYYSFILNNIRLKWNIFSPPMSEFFFHMWLEAIFHNLSCGCICISVQQWLCWLLVVEWHGPLRGTPL